MDPTTTMSIGIRRLVRIPTTTSPRFFVLPNRGSCRTISSGNQSINNNNNNNNNNKSSEQAISQKAAYNFYRRRREDTLWFRLFGKKEKSFAEDSQRQRNINTAWYAASIVVGALGATYAAVPLYKVFCQTTGFGGTTQRVVVVDTSSNNNENNNSNNSGVVERLLQSAVGSMPKSITSARVHTWTDEEAAAKLAYLKPVENADLLTIRFDTTVDDVMPWTFTPIQLDVKVVPGETALSFFRVTNRSDRAITGVATYNVYPPKVGMYFQKVQCFCFEEQRLLPGETVDMPVFFFIDPEMLKDPQVSYVKSITLSYFFHHTGEDDDDDDDDDEEEEKQKEKKD